MIEITIRRATTVDKPEWLRMRLLRRPDGTVESFFKVPERGRSLRPLAMTSLTL
jgi:hypothetical protein